MFRAKIMKTGKRQEVCRFNIGEAYLVNEMSKLNIPGEPG